MKRIKLSQYAKNNGISYMTAYRYFNSGIISGIKFPNGTILINDDAIYLNENIIQQKGIINVILYARVSSSENKSNLESQLSRLKNYASAKGYVVVKEVKEIGSGLNDKRKQLESVLKNSSAWDKIIVEHKDRLARFGLNYINVLLKDKNKVIEIINEVDGGKEDLIQDFVSIITSFCAKIYGQRRSKRKTEQIIKDLNLNK